MVITEYGNLAALVSPPSLSTNLYIDPGELLLPNMNIYGKCTVLQSESHHSIVGVSRILSPRINSDVTVGTTFQKLFGTS